MGCPSRASSAARRTAGTDDQPPAPTGEFLLGYPNQYGFPYPVPAPAALGTNGAYAALRVLRQDVDAL